MTFSLIKTAVAATIALGSFAAIPATASANDVGFYFGINDGRVHYRDHHRRDFDRRDREWGHGWGRGWDRDFCSDRHAVRKAWRHGMNRPFISRHGRRFVVVDGFKHHHRDRMVFANDRGCPIVRW